MKTLRILIFLLLLPALAVAGTAKYPGQSQVDIVSQSLTAVAVSKDSSANATGNRIWTTSDVDQVGGEAVGDHASTVIDHGIQPLLEAKDFDGSALPNAATEGQAAPNPLLPTWAALELPP